MKTRKILLSAYACEPGKGSEPGVGWRWALEIARLGHDVWVLTRANNRPPIEAQLAKLPTIKNLRFIYYDLPGWARWWKKGGRGVRLYYLLWQWGAYRLAREVHAQAGFDIVHHVTFVSVRQPSFMGNLGIPFIFGPVAGGEAAPWRLRFGYGWRGWIVDGLRDLSNFLVRVDPLMYRTFRQAERIYVTSEQTRALVPRRFRGKMAVGLAIGWDRNEIARISTERMGNEGNADTFRILYVGRLHYWKGMHLGLQAFAKLVRSHHNASLTIIGDGPDRPRWCRLADRLGVSGKVDWVPWLNRDQLFRLYARHDLLLFPSLHDSGGMVVLEGMAHGLPVVCLDLGGHGVMVDETCGRVISTRGATKSDVIENLGQALTHILKTPQLRRRLAQGALARARKYAWDVRVKHFYSAYGTIDSHKYP